MPIKVVPQMMITSVLVFQGQMFFCCKKALPEKPSDSSDKMIFEKEKPMMKTIRNIAAILTVLCMILTLFAGCQQQSTEKIDIGIIQLIENGAFNDMREGFVQQMKDRGYDESKANFHYKNAQGDSTNLNTICQEMVDNGMDLVVTIATPASQAMVNLESDIPVFFISVSNPVGARIISDMEKPDKNATGTSNAIPVNEIFDLADQLTPGCKTYGFLYNTGEINAVTTVESSKAYLDSIGLSYEEAVVANSSEVQQAAQSLIGKVDAFFIPNDSVIQSAMNLVAEVAREAKIPVYCSSNTTVESGGFATVAISDTQIGAITADMAVEYLGGKPIAEIPSVVVVATDAVINKTTAEAIGADIPEEVASEAILVEDAK